MQLIEYNAVDVEAVFGIGLRRQHLVEAVGRGIDDALGSRQNLYSTIQRRTHTHHVGSNIEYDTCLLAVSDTPII